jgi:transcription-repair coupling factor (superfamily II helicase)
LLTFLSQTKEVCLIVEDLIIYPCRELIIDQNIKTKALALGTRIPQLKELTEKISQGIYFEGIESMSVD